MKKAAEKITSPARPYHEFLVPFETKKLMDDAFQAFCKEVEALREKHRIAEVVVILCAPSVVTGGIGTFEVSAAFGNPNNAMHLIASTLGNWRGREYERMSVLRHER